MGREPSEEKEGREDANKLTEQQVDRLRNIYSSLKGHLYRESDGAEISQMYLYDSFRRWKSDFERFEDPETEIKKWEALSGAYREELDNLSDPDHRRKGIVFKILLINVLDIDPQQTREVPDVDHFDRITRRYHEHHPDHTA